MKEMDAVVAARFAVKSYTLASLGEGKKNGGPAECEKHRAEALERVRRVAFLSPEQTNDWKSFARDWDHKMAEVHGPLWAELFAEILQGVLEKLQAGDANALSVFMHNETLRVLGDVPCLLLPGA